MKFTLSLVVLAVASAVPSALGAAAGYKPPKPSAVPVKVCTYKCAAYDSYGHPLDNKHPPVHVYDDIKCTYTATYNYKPSTYTCTYNTKTGALVQGGSTCARKGDVNECHIEKPYYKRDPLPVRPVAGAVPVARRAD